MKRVSVWLFVVMVLAGCQGDAGGTVRAKREHRDSWGLMVRELCIGESAQTCTWIKVTGKTPRSWYERCSVGEQWPDCRKVHW